MNRITDSRPITFVLVLVGLLLAAVPSRARPVAELITMGPGDAIWMRFGHVAIRIVDPEQGRDEVFNYGYAPFGGPGFLWGFIRGEARFQLVVRSWHRTVEEYTRENRTIQRQPLNLSRDQIRHLVQFLEYNALPENREYLYDHLRDNCSTRVRDLLDEVTGGALRAAVGSMDRLPLHTYRTYTLEGGRGRLDALLGMDLIGGPNQETLVGRWDLLYLPVFLQQAVSQATHEVNGRRSMLAEPAEVVYQRIGPGPQQGSPMVARVLVLVVGFLLGPLLLLVGRRVRSGSGSAVLRMLGRAGGLLLAVVAGLFGLVGAALVFLMIVSALPDFRWNENVLVFGMLDFGWVVTGGRLLFLGRWNMGKACRIYLDLRLLVLGGLVVGKLAGLLVQDNWAFLSCAAFVLAGLRLGFGPVRSPAAATIGPGPREPTPPETTRNEESP